MTTYSWPSTLIPASFQIGTAKGGVVMRAPYSGGVQAVDFVAERLTASLTLPPKTRANSGAIESLLFRLAGGVNRVTLWHFARPAPLGTMRGAPTLTSGVARGASSIAVTTTAGATVKAGDMLGLGNHLLMVADDATANGSGAMTVNLVHRIRETVNAGTAITWDKPTAQFILPAMSAGVVHVARVIEGVAFDLEEAW